MQIWVCLKDKQPVLLDKQKSEDNVLQIFLVINMKMQVINSNFVNDLLTLENNSRTHL
jgi:hypothetical protein